MCLQVVPGARLPTYDEVFVGNSPANIPCVRFSSLPQSEMDEQIRTMGRWAKVLRRGK